MRPSQYWKYDTQIDYEDNDPRTAVITLRLSPQLKQEFQSACKMQEIETSEQLRRLMKMYLNETD